MILTHRQHLRGSRLARVVVLLAVLILGACGDRSSSPQPTPGDGDRGGTLRIKVTDRAGRPVAQLRSGRKTLHLELTLGESTVVVDGERAGEVRRYREGARLLAEATTEHGVTRAQGSDGRRLFELRGSGRRVRVFLGEAPGKLVVFARPAPERLRVLAGEREPEIGRVTHDGGRTRVRVRDPQGEALYESTSPRLSALFGVLLLADLPDRDKAVLMAELLWNGL
ncbi:MAG TPA: hypothetical protein VF017_15910 [Thermoanaerobaculia bacterium]|nr:hypothetical protein [Thermoanaerobaculia bacterium]